MSENMHRIGDYLINESKINYAEVNYGDRDNQEIYSVTIFFQNGLKLDFYEHEAVSIWEYLGGNKEAPAKAPDKTFKSM